MDFFSKVFFIWGNLLDIKYYFLSFLPNFALTFYFTPVFFPFFFYSFSSFKKKLSFNLFPLSFCFYICIYYLQYFVHFLLVLLSFYLFCSFYQFSFLFFSSLKTARNHMIHNNVSMLQKLG